MCWPPLIPPPPNKVQRLKTHVGNSAISIAMHQRATQPEQTKDESLARYTISSAPKGRTSTKNGRRLFFCWDWSAIWSARRNLNTESSIWRCKHAEIEILLTGQLQAQATQLAGAGDGGRVSQILQRTLLVVLAPLNPTTSQ